MGRTGAIAAFALLAALVAGCTSSPPDPPPSHSAPSTPGLPSTTVSRPDSTPPPSTAAPAEPTVPADVPTTGPNARAGETPPLMPVAATAHTAAGAEAFAKFFIRTIDWGYATINGSYLRHYSAAGCSTCTSLVKGFDSDQKAGRQYIGGRLTILAVRPGKSGAERSEIVTVNGTSFEELGRDGKYITADAAHNGLKFKADLAWRADAWAVRELAVVP